MTRLLKQFILTAMLALFASQASALFVQADIWDPRIQGVGTNRYAYAGSDPVNMSDPNGHAAICAGGSCVHVDANNDGDITDDDLTPEQIEIFARDYKDFILDNDGLNLSSYGARVRGGTAEEQGYLRSASQFIGYNLDGGFGDDLTIIPGRLADPRLGSATAGRLDKIYPGLTDTVTYRLFINLGFENHQGENASELGRTLLHEYNHRDDQMGVVYPLNDAHRAIDNRAIQSLKNFGLSNGGCSPIGGSSFLGITISQGYSGC